MSRTIRRKNCYKANTYIVKKDEISSWDYRRYGTKDHDLILAKSKANFHRDHRSRKFECGYPRLTGEAVRFANKMEMIRCLKMDCWDDFKPINGMGNFDWMFW